MDLGWRNEVRLLYLTRSTSGASMNREEIRQKVFDALGIILVDKSAIQDDATLVDLALDDDDIERFFLALEAAFDFTRLKPSGDRQSPDLSSLRCTGSSSWFCRRRKRDRQSRRKGQGISIESRPFYRDAWCAPTKFNMRITLWPGSGERLTGAGGDDHHRHEPESVAVLGVLSNPMQRLHRGAILAVCYS